MGQLNVDLFITLDGYASGEGAPGYFGYLGPDLERWIDDNLAGPQVLLMGRVTYEAMSAIAQNEPVEGADRMNELPKVVFSRTLQEPLEWNNSRDLRRTARRQPGTRRHQRPRLPPRHGALDLIGGPAQSRQIAPRVPDAELLVLPDCGHMPALEQPQTYRDAVLNWCAARD